MQVIHDTWASLWTRSANSPAKPMLWQELCERPCCQARALAKAQKGKDVFLTEVLQACLKNCTPIPATPAAQSVSFEMSKPPMSLHARVARFLIPALATPPGTENKKDTIFKIVCFYNTHVRLRSNHVTIGARTST